jgi:hypothetical protein
VGGKAVERDDSAGESHPLVQVYAWVAVHSALEVGLLRAKMRGLLFNLAISSHTALEKDPPWALMD